MENAFNKNKKENNIKRLCDVILCTVGFRKRKAQYLISNATNFHVSSLSELFSSLAKQSLYFFSIAVTLIKLKILKFIPILYSKLLTLPTPFQALHLFQGLSVFFSTRHPFPGNDGATFLVSASFREIIYSTLAICVIKTLN